MSEEIRDEEVIHDLKRLKNLLNNLENEIYKESLGKKDAAKWIIKRLNLYADKVMWDANRNSFKEKGNPSPNLAYQVEV